MLPVTFWLWYRWFRILFQENIFRTHNQSLILSSTVIVALFAFLSCSWFSGPSCCSQGSLSKKILRVPTIAYKISHHSKCMASIFHWIEVLVKFHISNIFFYFHICFKDDIYLQRLLPYILNPTFFSFTLRNPRESFTTKNFWLFQDLVSYYNRIQRISLKVLLITCFNWIFQLHYFTLNIFSSTWICFFKASLLLFLYSQ